MSAHLMIVAGYLDLPLSHKLALMKVCDSADDGNRLGFPGLEAVRLWSGTKRSRALDVIKDLQEWGLIMQVEAGHRGKRAVFKVFPNPGDEAFSLAARQKKECPGAAKFKGAPPMPTGEEVKARVEGMDAEPGQWNGSGAADPSRKGPATRTQSEGSSAADPIDERVQSDSEKGPGGRAEGSGVADPFGSTLPPNPASSPAAADAPSGRLTVTVVDSTGTPGQEVDLFGATERTPAGPGTGVGFLGQPEEPADDGGQDLDAEKRRIVQTLVAAYVDVATANGGHCPSGHLKALGSNVKRIVRDDNIPPEVLLVAVRQAAATGRKVIDDILVAPRGPQASWSRPAARRAMQESWIEMGRKLDEAAAQRRSAGVA